MTTIPCLLALIYIGSPTVFNDVVSLSVSGLYGSYLIPCSLLLWRRVSGIIKPYDKEEHTSTSVHTFGADAGAIDLGSTPDASDDDVVRLRLMWGPWKLPGILGTINNAFACVYCVFVLFWDFWPSIYPATAKTMNYSVLVTGFTLIVSVVYYYAYGRYEYKGPLVDRGIQQIQWPGEE